MKTPRPLRWLCALVALAGAAALGSAPVASADATSDYNNAYALGTQAYEYGVPLLDMQRVFSSTTANTVCNHINGHGPVNQFCSIRKLATAAETTVNAPNDDTPYSSAFLDLSKQPMVLHAPPIKHRFWEFELLDPWTNDFYNITSAIGRTGPGSWGVTDGGNWAVVGPHFKGKLPKGVIRVSSRYNRVWVIGRTFVRNQADLVNVHKIQDEYSITPLSKFGTSWSRRRPRRGSATRRRRRSRARSRARTRSQFFVALDKEMKLFPPPARDKPLLAKLRPYGIGAGLDPLKAGLSAAALQGLRDAVTQRAQRRPVGCACALPEGVRGPPRLSDHRSRGVGNELHAARDRRQDRPRRPAGRHRDLSRSRCCDDTKAPLTGSKRYVIHLSKSQLPIPVHAFWSLTMYNNQSFFVANPLNRYLLNDLSHLRKNADGSIDIYVQAIPPEQPGPSQQLAARTARGSGLPAHLATV